jgi:hypothetical protein
MIKKWSIRFGWMALGIGALYAFSALAGVVSGGSLDPPGPPGPSMKSLDDISGIWDRQLVANDGPSCNSSRFTCVMLRQTCSNQVCFFTYDGVLDRETGLVWQRDPSTNPSVVWANATSACYDISLGGRLGWRPATAAELASIMDPDASGTSLPPGHPFQNVSSGEFWTSTETPDDPSRAFHVSLGFGGGVFSFLKTYQSRAWCVRGPNTQ